MAANPDGAELVNDAQTQDPPELDAAPPASEAETAGIANPVEPAQAAADTAVGMPDLAKPVNPSPDAAGHSIDLLKDVELDVKIELGRARMYVEDVLKLSEGSVVELDKLAGDPVDIFVNERLVARGEVLVLNDNFCVRVNQIVSDIV